MKAQGSANQKTTKQTDQSADDTSFGHKWGGMERTNNDAMFLEPNHSADSNIMKQIQCEIYRLVPQVSNLKSFRM